MVKRRLMRSTVSPPAARRDLSSARRTQNWGRRLLQARGYDMKVITVDDQFVNAKGKPMESVPLVMMAASEIGARQEQELYKEMQKRGWDVKDTGVMAITADELDTARRRTTGSIDALKAAGFPEKQIYRVPTKSNDILGVRCR